MPQRYFDKFPVITYDNSQAVDITKRVAVLDKISNEPFVFYPYEITANERPDQLSARYYDDQFKSWILYLSNKITDPYYEWYLHNTEFVDFLVKKYGSYYDAQEKIKYYKNDWENADPITVSGFDALPASLQIYWEPVLGSYNRTTSYRRKQVDWKLNTNKIVQYTVNNSNNFIRDEICTIVFDNYSSGKGQVLSTSNNVVNIQHVKGSYFTSNTVSITASSYIYGSESKSNTLFTAVSYVANNMAAEEEVYWRPVSYFDFENEKNEFNKTIRVLDSRLKQTAVDNLTDLMKV